MRGDTAEFSEFGCHGTRGTGIRQAHAAEDGAGLTLSGGLSGIWAGHTAGLLVAGNRFVRNNRGRLFGGWADSQAALSCPQGRAAVVGNTFEENWVAVSLRAAEVPEGWQWAAETLTLAAPPDRFAFRYTHRKDSAPAAILWLYLLDDADLAQQPAEPAGATRADYLLSMPGARRRMRDTKMFVPAVFG